MNARHDRSVPDIVADLLRQFTSLVSVESRLARAELGERVGQMTNGLVMAMIGAVLVIPALVVLLEAAVAGLEQAGLTPPWAALAIGGGTLLIGLILVLVGLKSLKTARLVPVKTIRQLQEDAAVAKQQAGATLGERYERQRAA